MDLNSVQLAPPSCPRQLQEVARSLWQPRLRAEREIISLSLPPPSLSLPPSLPLSPALPPSLARYRVPPSPPPPSLSPSLPPSLARTLPTASSTICVALARASCKSRDNPYMNIFWRTVAAMTKGRTAIRTRAKRHSKMKPAVHATIMSAEFWTITEMRSPMAECTL